MNPITALMLTQAVEADRRREIERRRRRPAAHATERHDHDGRGRRPWGLRLPRFGLATAKG